MPRIDTGAHTFTCPLNLTVVTAHEPHWVGSPFDALIAFMAAASNEPDAANTLLPEVAESLLDILWKHCAGPDVCETLHIAWNGIFMEITEHVEGLEVRDCASGECRLVYGCDLETLKRAAAAKVLGMTGLHNPRHETFDHDGDAGHFPQELWEEIALHLDDHDDLAALLSTSRQFGQNLGARARLLQLRAFWAFNREEIPTLSALKAVLALIKPWPYPARFGTLCTLVENCKVFKDEPEARLLLVQQVRALPDRDRRHAFILFTRAVSPSLFHSDVLWRQCAAELLAIRTGDSRDRASALVALAASFGNWNLFTEEKAKIEDLDNLFNEASELAPDDQRTVMGALAGAAPRLWSSRSGEAAWTRCVAAIHKLNQTLSNDCGAALVGPAKSWHKFRSREIMTRTCQKMLAAFATLDPSDPYWPTIYTELERGVHFELPRPSTSLSTALATLQSVVVELSSDHPNKGRTLRSLMSTLLLSGCFNELTRDQDGRTFISIVQAVVTLANDAPDKKYAVQEVLSSIPRLPAELRTSVWDLIHSAVPGAFATADAELRIKLQHSLDLAIDSMPEQRATATLHHAAKRPRRVDGGN